MSQGSVAWVRRSVAGSTVMVETGGAASRTGAAETTRESSVCTFVVSDGTCADSGMAPTNAPTVVVAKISLQTVM